MKTIYKIAAAFHALELWERIVIIIFAAQLTADIAWWLLH